MKGCKEKLDGHTFDTTRAATGRTWAGEAGRLGDALFGQVGEVTGGSAAPRGTRQRAVHGRFCEGGYVGAAVGGRRRDAAPRLRP